MYGVDCRLLMICSGSVAGVGIKGCLVNDSDLMLEVGKECWRDIKRWLRINADGESLISFVWMKYPGWVKYTKP